MAAKKTRYNAYIDNGTLFGSPVTNKSPYSGRKTYNRKAKYNYNQPSLQMVGNIMYYSNGKDMTETIVDEAADKVVEKLSNNNNAKKVEASASKKARELLKIRYYASHPIQAAFDAAQDSLEKSYKENKSDETKILEAFGFQNHARNTSYAVASGGVQLAKKATELAVQTAQVATNRYITLTEDYIANQTINNVKDTVSRLANLGSGIASGASTGSAFGPVGAAVGAAIGAASWGVSQYIQYQQRISGYYQQLNASNIQMNYDASRLGLAGGSGTEN